MQATGKQLLCRRQHEGSAARTRTFNDAGALGRDSLDPVLQTWFYGPRLAKEMIYSGMRLLASLLYGMGQVLRLCANASTLQRDALQLAQEIAERDPAPLRQAKRASNITMDIMGRHYVLSRMEELLDPAPALTLQLPHDSEAS